MSVNTAHANNGVLIHSGEFILLHSDNVTIEFFGQDSALFKGSKTGRLYLTTHRIIFNNKSRSDPMQSFSFPFILLRDVDIEQPVFGANYIKGIIRAQPNGNWTGEAKFKLVFKSGGAIEYGQAMLHAARMAQSHFHSDAPPPYTPPTGDWYEAPPPAYQPPPGYYGWVPQNGPFNTSIPPNSVYMSNNLPPYPGISGPQNPPPHQPQPGYPGAPPGYQAGYPGGFQPPQMHSGGYQPGPNPGYPGVGPTQGAGYPAGTPGFQQPGGYPPPAGHGYPSQNPQNGYPSGGAAGGSTNIGFTAGQPRFQRGTPPIRYRYASRVREHPVYVQIPYQEQSVQPQYPRYPYNQYPSPQQSDYTQTTSYQTNSTQTSSGPLINTQTSPLQHVQFQVPQQNQNSEFLTRTQRAPLQHVQFQVPQQNQYSEFLTHTQRAPLQHVQFQAPEQYQNSLPQQYTETVDPHLPHQSHPNQSQNSSPQNFQGQYSQLQNPQSQYLDPQQKP